jgi:hypothetical protein
MKEILNISTGNLVADELKEEEARKALEEPADEVTI